MSAYLTMLVHMVFKRHVKPDVVVHGCNHSDWVAEAERLGVSQTW